MGVREHHVTSPLLAFFSCAVLCVTAFHNCVLFPITGVSIPDHCSIIPGPEHPGLPAHGSHHWQLPLMSSVLVCQVAGKTRWLNEPAVVEQWREQIDSMLSGSLNKWKHCSRRRLGPTVYYGLNGCLWATERTQSIFIKLLLRGNILQVPNKLFANKLGTCHF